MVSIVYIKVVLNISSIVLQQHGSSYSNQDVLQQHGSSYSNQDG